MASSPPHAGDPSSSNASSNAQKYRVPRQALNNQKPDGAPNNSNNEDGKRNRRLMADVQATLLNGATLPKNISSKGPRKAAKQSLVFEDISEALDRIKLADSDLGASLSDVRPYLLENIGTFSERELDELCTVFCCFSKKYFPVLSSSAVQKTNAYYIVGLCGDLIGVQKFQARMSDHLISMIKGFLSETEKGAEDLKALPEFLALLSMARWPRPYGKAIEGSNMILYIVINTVMGWIQFISETAEKEDEAQTEADKLLFIKCAEALCTFCMTGQRSLWLNFPELFDGVYGCTKSLLVSNMVLTRSLKASLLQLHVLLNKWSMSNVPRYSTVGTQTVFKPS